MRFVLSIAAFLALINPLSAQSSSSSTGSFDSSSKAFVSSSTGSSSNVSLSHAQSNDLAVLNTALTVAHLEASFFGCQLYPLNQTFDFCANQTKTTFAIQDFQTFGFNTSVFQAFETVARQSVEHVQLLTQAIQAINATAAVPRCSAYNYQRTGSIPANTNQTLATFFAGAQSLSGSSAAIHLGALSAVTSSDLITVVAALAAVEARHHSYFFQIMGFAPFSSAGFDTPVSSTQASLILQSWMLRCSGVTFTLPTIRPYGIALNTANITNAGFAQGVVYTGRLSEENRLTYTPQQRTNDVLTLKYLLFIESLQQALFNASNTLWNETAWTSAGFNESVYDIVQDMSSNDDTHASVLRSMISLYDDSSLVQADRCVYNFTSLLSNVNTFTRSLSTLKQWSASAYTGVANALTDTDLQQLVGSITTIEARHSAILNLVAAGNRNAPLIALNQSSSFPFSTEPSLTASQAVADLRSLNLIVSCSNNLTLPGTAPSIIPSPIKNETISSSSTGAFFNQSSSSSVFVNGSSSTGVIGNLSSSTGAFFNGSSSSGSFFNGSSSSSSFFNGSSSSGSFFNGSSSSSSFFNGSSSSSSFFNGSSTGAFVNVSSSTGAFNQSTGLPASSTGAFNQSTGLPSSSSTVNFTSSSSSSSGAIKPSSSSSSSPFDNLSSSSRSSSSSSSARSSSSSSAGFVDSSSSSLPIFDPSSSVEFPELSSTGEDLQDPGVNSAASLQTVTYLAAVTVAAVVYMM